MKKKLAFILAFVILSVSIFSFPVMAAAGQWKYDSSHYGYYYLENGVRHSGWLQIGDTWYYCDPDWYNIRIESGSAYINEKWYYFDDYGKMVTGWIELDGTWYYFKSSGAMATGWQKINGKWYYMNSGGAMLTGWIKDNGKWYYMKDSGAMVTGWYKINDYWYYFNSSGAQMTGWQKIDGYWYYLNESMYYGGVATIGGKKYLFASSGKMLTGWQKWTTTIGSMEWFYFDSNGAMHIGWLKDGGNWYYLSESMARNGYKDINGKRYYFNSSGVCTNPY